MRENIWEMIVSSDDRAALLLRAVAKGDPGAIAMVRKGWSEYLADQRVVVTNFRMVAGLMASFTVGLSMTPIEVTDVSDGWEDSRQKMQEAAQSCCAVAASLSIWVIIMSVVWVNYSMGFVLDADDALWFQLAIPSAIVDVMLGCCLATTGVAPLPSRMSGLALPSRSPSMSFCSCSVRCGTFPP